MVVSVSGFVSESVCEIEPAVNLNLLGLRLGTPGSNCSEHIFPSERPARFI